MSEIYVNDAGLRRESDALMEKIASLELPDLCSTTEATVASLQFIPNLYNAFKEFVNSYIKIISRDVATVTDMALAFYVYDNAWANLPSDVNWYPEVERQLDVSLASFECPAIRHANPDWIINVHDLNLIISEVLDRLANLMDKLEGESGLASAINTFTSTENFSGDAAMATLSYLNTNHRASAYGLYACAHAMFTHISDFWNRYAENPIFQSSEEMECQFCRYELERLYNCLVEKEEYVIGLFPTLDSAIEQAYADSGYMDDYSSSVPNGFSYINGFYSPKLKIQNVVNTVEANESYLAILTRWRINRSFEPFLSLLRQIIEHGRRYDYTFPPNSMNNRIDTDNAVFAFRAMVTRNSYIFVNDINTAWERAVGINTEVALENRRTQLQGSIAANTLGITLAVVSIILTCGADAPAAIVVIAACSESIYISTHGSDLIEDAQDLYYVNQGILDGDSVNLFCDYGLGFYPEDGIESLLLPTRRELYEGIESGNDLVYGVVVPTANYTGSMSYSGQLVSMGTRSAIRYTVNGVVTYVCPESAGMITYLITIPLNGLSDELTQAPHTDYWEDFTPAFGGAPDRLDDMTYNVIDGFGVANTSGLTRFNSLMSNLRSGSSNDPTNGYVDPMTGDGNEHIYPNNPVINPDHLL